MFFNDDIIFLEMQKTGGSHILHLLSRFLEGENIGKHNRVNHEHINKFTVGSIRNPWDWYVSLWAYGVSGKGAIRYRTGIKIDSQYYLRLLPKYMGKNRLNPSELVSSIFHDILKPTDLWLKSYHNHNNAENFRLWLKMILDEKRRYDIGEGYAFSPISKSAGLMTYRYLRLFTIGNSIYTDSQLTTDKGIIKFDKNNNFSNFIIKTESLEDDFITAMDLAGSNLTTMQKEQIKSSRKTNVSARKNVNYYYDKETIDLVAEKERFLIEKYQYQMPNLT